MASSSAVVTEDESWTSIHADASVHSIESAKDGGGEEEEARKFRLRRERRGLNAFVVAAPSSELEDQLFLGGGEDFNLTTIHDREQNETSTSDGSVYTFSDQQNHTEANETTAVVGTDNTAENIEFKPIRFQAFLGQETGGGEFLDEEQHEYLMLRVIRPALIYWSAALRVEPVVGNLTVDRSQLVYDQRSCGPPDLDAPRVKIPLSHLELGVEKADFLLYVNLAFRNGTQMLDRLTDNKRHSRHEGNTTEHNAPRVCSGEYFAASTFCSTDQNDRPIAAMLHLCIDEDFLAEERQDSNIMIVLHELGHALGFNAVSLAHFRARDGSPLTARDPRTGEIPLTDVNCTGPVEDAISVPLPLPSPDILQFRTVRGGLRVAEIVTPLVRQVVRNHFDCQDLPGAELESGEPTSCIGDHWERRLFKTELLNPLVDGVAFNPLFSSLTLAYFADSGWYQVDLSRASSAAGWGRAAGCDFVEKECVQDGQVPAQYESFFCNQVISDENGFSGDIQGCTHDLVSKAFCSMENYDGELPPVFRYFNGSNVGGDDPFMDYCPVYSGFANGLCSDKQNEALIRVNGVERFGMQNSRCLSGKKGSLVIDPVKQNLSEETIAPTAAQIRLEHTTSQHTAVCIPIACVVEDQSLRLQVDGIWEVCHHKDDVIIPKSALEHFQASGFFSSTETISVICPDPVRVCPTFYCKRDCLGTNQICDYNAGECVCPNGGELDDGLCKPSNTTAFFMEEATETGLPDPNDPVAAIYVPKARLLHDESRRFWTKRNSILVSALLGAVGAMLSFLVRVYIGRTAGKATSEDDDDSSPDAPPTTEPRNSEKDKMVASLVVDLRMHHPELQERDDTLRNRDSETDTSMTDTESSTLDRTASFHPPTIADLSEHIQLPSPATDGMEDALSPLGSSPQIRARRRGIFNRR